MPFYAQYDHTAPAPAPVIGWYDTSTLTYAALPDEADLLLLDEQQWQDHLANTGGYAVDGGALVDYTAPPQPPPTLQEQATVQMSAPVTLTCTSQGDLNADYAMDQTSRTRISTIANSLLSGGGVPGGGSTFNWPDVDSNPHYFAKQQFIDFSQAVTDYEYNLSQVSLGIGTTLPPASLTIA